jgi:hypothetical protein
MLGADRAEAQYGYGGVYGGGYGYGAGMGMTLEDQQLLKAQIYALNTSHVQLNEAQALREYWAAVLLREQAISAAQPSRKPTKGVGVPTPDKPRAARASTHRRHATRPIRVGGRNPSAVGGIPAGAGRDQFDPSLRSP